MAEYNFDGVRKLQQEKDDAATGNLRRAENEDPASAARVSTISRSTGVAPNVVAAAPDEIERAYNFDGVRNLQNRSPVTNTFLTDYSNAVVARNDVGALEQIEAVLRGFPAGFDEFIGMSASGFGRFNQLGGRMLARGADAALPESLDKYIWMTEESPEMLEAIPDPATAFRGAGDYMMRLAEATAGPKESQTFASDVSKGLGQLLGQAMISISTPVSLTANFMTGVDIQGQKQDETGTGGTMMADLALLEGGAVTAASEKLGLDQLLERVPPNVKSEIGRVVADIMIAGGIEAVQEATENAAQNLIAATTTNANQQIGEGMIEEASVAGVVGMIARGLVRAVVPMPVRRVDNEGDEGDVETRRRFAEIDRLNDIAEAAEMRTSDPERFMQFIATNDGTRNTQVYIDAEKLAAYLDTKVTSINKLYPVNKTSDRGLQILAAAAAEAQDTGTVAAVSLPEFVTYIAGTPHFAALRESLSLNPMQVGTEQQQKQIEERKKYIQDLMQQANENVSLYTEAQALFERVKAQLIDTGMVTARNADVMARIVPAFAMRYAKDNGISIEEVFSKLSVEGPQTGEKARIEADAAMLQPGDTETQAFKNWFDGSVVVDETGAPLVVYRGQHGANDNIETKLGSLSFGSKEAADTYAMDPNDTGMTAEAPKVYPVYLRIKNPLMIDRHGDPFIDLSTIEKALGREEAVRVAEKFSGSITNTDNWYDILEQTGAISVRDFVTKFPERVGELYFEAYEYLDDAEEVAKLKAAGYDGAIHGGSGETAGDTEYKVFDRLQIKSTISPDVLMQSAGTDLYSPLARFIASMNLPQWKGKSQQVGWKLVDKENGNTIWYSKDMSKEEEAELNRVASFYPDVGEIKPAMFETPGAARGPDIWAKIKSAPVKKEEIEWVGIEDLLLSADGTLKFTRQEVLDFVNANGVRVETIVADQEEQEEQEGTVEWEDEEAIEADLSDRVEDMLYEFDRGHEWNENWMTEWLGAHPEAIAEFYDIEIPDYAENSASGVYQWIEELETPQPLPLFPDEEAVARTKSVADDLRPAARDDYTRWAEEQAEQEYLSNPTYIVHTDAGPYFFLLGNDEMGWSLHRGHGVHNSMRVESGGVPDGLRTGSVYSLNEAKIQAESYFRDHGIVEYQPGTDPKLVAKWGSSSYLSDDALGNSNNYREYKLTLPGVEGDFYYTTHFDDRNIVAFVRATDRRFQLPKSDLKETNEVTVEKASDRVVLRDQTTGEVVAEWAVGSEVLDMAFRQMQDYLKRVNVKFVNNVDGAVYRTVGDGKTITSDGDVSVNTFFIEEFQSDWHQQGRKKGYVMSEAELEAAQQAKSEAHAKYVVEETEQLQNDLREIKEKLRAGDLDENMKASLLDIEQSIYKQLTYLAQSEAPLVKNSGIANAPFKDDAWMSLGLKRMILEAIDNGYTHIAWPNANVLMDRWSENYAELYENQYDKKMPSIVKKLLGVTPKQLDAGGDPIVRGQSYIDAHEVIEVKVDDSDEPRYSVVSKSDGKVVIDRFGTAAAAQNWINDVATDAVPPGYWIAEIPQAVKDRIINDGGLPLFQGNTKSARGYFDPKNSIIRLTEAADASTFMHEFAHFMYEMEILADGPMRGQIESWFKRNATEVAAEANTYLGEQTPNFDQGYDAFAPEKRLRPFQPAIDAAKRYAEKMGLPFDQPRDFAPLNMARGRRIARAYEAMQHRPNDPEVKAAYAAMVRETIAQFEEVLATGIELHFIRGNDPYKNNPRGVIDDVVNNNRMFVFSTRDGFGSNADFDPKENPLLAETEFEIDGEKILVNDIFRVVHDYFGHVKNGVGFRAEGEENAWQSHASMYSPLARRAMTTETRGQNSWVNFGPHGDRNRRASAADTIYADQKTGLLPLWASEEGHINVGQADDTTGRDESGNLIAPPVQDGRVTLTHFSTTSGLNSIDPAFYGTGYAGAEKARSTKRGWINRSYYGIEVDKPGGYRRERGIGGNRYVTSIDANQLYDAATDPAGLREKLTAREGTPQRLNQYERAIRDAGYSGYWVNDNMMMAVVFDSLPVEQQLNISGEELVADYRQDFNKMPGSDGPITEADVNQYIDNKTTGDDRKDSAIRRAMHEQFARGFEQYVMEGRAPSVELRNVFRMLASWIADVYRRLRGFMKVKLDDDMRKVFDRLLATEEQIAAAEARGRAQPMFNTAEEAGMTPAQWTDYSQKAAAVPAKAQETLRKKVMEELTRQTEAWWQTERDDLAVEETARLQATAPYRAITALRSGVVKLDHAEVKQRVGQKNINKAGIESVRIPPVLNGMTKKGGEGLPVDQAAALLGFGSGDELLYTLMNTQPIADAAQAAAEARMLEIHGDIMNDGTIARQADEAVQNEERGRLMLAELRAIRKNAENAPKLDLATVKAAAREAIAAMPYAKIHPEKYRAAEIRFAREAADAHASNDPEGAAFAKSQQILNHYYAIAATEARDELVGIVEFMARYNKKSVREEIMKAEGGFWEQIVKILGRFEFRKNASQAKVSEANQALEAWARDRMEVDGDNLVLTPEVMNELFATHWKNVPLDQLRGIQNSVKNIEHVARYANKITRLGDEVSFKKLVADWTEAVNEKVTTKYRPQRSTVNQKSTIQRWAAQMTKIPFLASWLDGGERVGLTHQIVMQPMTDALHQEQELWKVVGTPIMQALQNRSKADLKRHNTKFFIPEIKDEKNDGNLMGHEILAVALNVGNESNLRKLLLGEGWANADDDTTVTLENPKLQAVLKYMTPGDWELVQMIWSQIDILYPMLADTYRRTSGLTPPKVASRAFEINGIKLAGGYYPIKYDPNRSSQAAINEEKKAANVDSMFSAGGNINASVNASAVNTRTKYFAPIRLSLDVVPNHVQETIHYITHHDAVREVNKFLRNPTVRETIISKMGEYEYQQFIFWLNDVAKDGREAPNKSFIDDVMNRMRFGITLGAMGFKASTGIMQLSGLSNAIAEVGVGNMAAAMKQILFSPQSIRDSWAFASGNSKVLINRTKTMDRELRAALERIEGKRNFTAAIQEASMKHIMYIQTYAVDLPTWYGAYIKELGESGNETKAIQYADWAVENVQGSGSTKDMAGFLRNQSGVHRMFTMFMTYFSVLWNMQRDTVRGARYGRYSATTTAAKAMFLIALPVIFESLVRGNVDAPEDEDDLAIWQQLLLKVSLYPLQSIPFLRDIVSAATGEFGYTMSPVASTLEKGVEASVELTKRGFTDEEITKAQVENTVKLAGVVVGVPGMNQAWDTGEHVYQVIAEGEELTGRELLFGPEPE